MEHVELNKCKHLEGASNSWADVPYLNLQALHIQQMENLICQK